MAVVQVAVAELLVVLDPEDAAVVDVMVTITDVPWELEGETSFRGLCTARFQSCSSKKGREGSRRYRLKESAQLRYNPSLTKRNSK